MPSSWPMILDSHFFLLLLLVVMVVVVVGVWGGCFPSFDFAGLGLFSSCVFMVVLNLFNVEFSVLCFL